MTRQVLDEVILLDMATEGYFGLNPTSAVVFGAFRSGIDVDGAVEAVLEHFEVEEPEARSDVLELAQTLVELGFLSVIDSAPDTTD